MRPRQNVTVRLDSHAPWILLERSGGSVSVTHDNVMTHHATAACPPRTDATDNRETTSRPVCSIAAAARATSAVEEDCSIPPAVVRSIPVVAAAAKKTNSIPTGRWPQACVLMLTVIHASSYGW